MPAAHPVSRAERFARGVGFVINPLVLPPLLFGAILIQFDAPLAETILVAGTSLLLLAILPAGFLGWMVRSGRAASIEILDRGARTRPYLFGVVCTVAAAVCLATFVETQRPLVLGVAVCIVLNTIVLAAVNRAWKISVHAAAVSGFVTILLFTSHVAAPDAFPVQQGTPSLSWWMLPVIPLVMWARVRSRAHSTGQVVAGALFGVTAPLLELAAFLQYGVFAQL